MIVVHFTLVLCRILTREVAGVRCSRDIMCKFDPIWAKFLTLTAHIGKLLFVLNLIC